MTWKVVQEIMEFGPRIAELEKCIELIGEQLAALERHNDRQDTYEQEQNEYQ